MNRPPPTVRRRPMVAMMLVACTLLGACRAEPGDLRAELAELSRDLRGRVDPLRPLPLPMETAELWVERDPFRER